MRALAILLPLLAPTAFPAAALAHASLLRSDPAAGTVVPHAPARIVLHFDQPVQDAGTTAVATSGTSVLAGHARLEHGDSRALAVPLRRGLGDGDYTVRWRVVSADGHIVSGVVAIGVGRGRPPPQAATTETSALDWPFLVARFAYFLGLMLLVGGAVFRVAVFRPVIATVAGRPRAMAELREGARANSLLLGAAALMLAGGWIALTRQGAEVAGVSFWQAFNHHGPIGSALGATRFGREFGRGIDLGAAFCVATAATFGVAHRSRAAALALAVPAAGLGAWAVIVPGLSGHAGDPGLGLPAVAVDALHTAAAAIWIGGLVQLVLVTPHATRGLPDGERSRVRAALNGRFSRIALASVAVLAATGVGRSLWAVSAPAELWETGYGRTLLVKTGLFLCVVGLAYLNRRRLAAFGVIRKLGGLEIGLLVAVLAAVSLLTDLPPANEPGVGSAASAPAGGPVSLRLAPAGSWLALWPGVAGRNAIDVRLPAVTGPTMSVGTSAGRATLRRAPDGSYAGMLPALPQGRARLRIGRLTAGVAIGPRPGSPPAPAAPAPTGATAAAEAADLAVGGQRAGRHMVRLTLLSQTGAGVPDAIALVDGHVAVPCPGVKGVCYQAPVTPRSAPLHVAVARPGVARVATTLQLPGADARAVPGLLRRAARTFAALRSLRSENVLASGPGRSVSTTFIAGAPNRLEIDIHGGARSRIIGTTRWDRRADGTWRSSYTPAIRQPDPFWAPAAEAVYVAGGDARTIQLTLVQPGGPTFFRLWVDRRTHLVTRLRMVTAAHFMRERELDPNSAPPVVPPA